MNRVSIGSDNGLSPIRRQAIIWTNAAILLIIGIDHDTVCAGVVCAATYGTARVEPAVAQPLAASPASPTSAVPGVAAQTTTAQTAGVVNFYSTTKTKQYTTINPATIMTMSRHAWNALADNAIVMMKASIETVSE